MNYETSLEIEIAVAIWFGIRTHVIVPNLSWALMPYECDLAVLSKLGYLYEIEIKVSQSDLIKDKSKYKWKYYYSGDGKHNSLRKIRKMWFAIPKKLENAIEHIPQQAGVFIVDKNGHVTETRKPTIDNTARKLSDRDQFNFARLGAMRIWALKKALVRYSNNCGGNYIACEYKLEKVSEGEADASDRG